MPDKTFTDLEQAIVDLVDNSQYINHVRWEGFLAVEWGKLQNLVSEANIYFREPEQEQIKL